MIQMKFYEVAPQISLTQHSFTICPICFSGKMFKRLPPDLQAAIMKAGPEAGAHGRRIESSENDAKLNMLAKEGKIKLHPFADRAKLLELAAPVKAKYAADIGAQAILTKIDSVEDEPWLAERLLERASGMPLPEAALAMPLSSARLRERDRRAADFSMPARSYRRCAAQTRSNYAALLGKYSIAAQCKQLVPVNSL